MNSRSLALLYRNAHNRMRDIEGLLPQEAFDELLKFLFYKEHAEDGNGPPKSIPAKRRRTQFDPS